MIDFKKIDEMIELIENNEVPEIIFLNAIMLLYL